jgi:hypothetical protein
MTTANTLRSQELTFEIDGPKITADELRRSFGAFLDVINEVAREVSGIPHSVDWIVSSVSTGSARIHLRAESISKILPTHKIPDLLDTIQIGFQIIEGTSTRPSHFNDSALRKVRELASIVNGGQDGPDSIIIRRDGQINSVTTKTLSNVDSFFGTESKDWGSIEGKLTGIFERGGYKLWVYDDLLRKNIPCQVPSELLEEVLKAFGKRVSVSGLIRYRRGGEINNIVIEDFEVFPDPRSLPGFDEVRGLFRSAD